MRKKGDAEGKSECSPGAPFTSCADEKIGEKGLLGPGDWVNIFSFLCPLSVPLSLIIFSVTDKPFLVHFTSMAMTVNAQTARARC